MPRNYSLADTIKLAKKKYYEKHNADQIQAEEVLINEPEENSLDLHIQEEEKESTPLDHIQEQTNPESIKKEEDKGFLKSLFDWFK